VALARALAAAPLVLLADEPGAGLDTRESAELAAVLRRLVGDGLGILLIDHDMNLVLSVCDRVAVLVSGTKIAEGTPAQVRADGNVIAAYLGGAA
jgi:ABC-type branched-subunit amino acid transport system ATPase component